jgi:hypothetical protein
MLMLRGISSNGAFGQAKQCVINAFDTNYLMSADEVMASIIHLARNMDEEVTALGLPAPDTSAPPISAFVGSNSGRGHNSRGTRGGRGLPNKCSVCGSLNHIMFSCTTSDDALPKWTLGKRKMIVPKYGTSAGSACAHVGLLSGVPLDDLDTLPTLEECTDDFDNTEVTIPFTSVAFSSPVAPCRDLSQFKVVDSACSINLTAFRHDFVTFDPPLLSLALAGSVLTLRAVAQYGFPSSWRQARSSTAQFMRYTPMTSPLPLLNTLVASSVSVECSRIAVVNLFFRLTLILD